MPDERPHVQVSDEDIARLVADAVFPAARQAAALGLDGFADYLVKNLTISSDSPPTKAACEAVKRAAILAARKWAFVLKHGRADYDSSMDRKDPEGGDPVVTLNGAQGLEGFEGALKTWVMGHVAEAIQQGAQRRHPDAPNPLRSDPTRVR